MLDLSVELSEMQNFVKLNWEGFRKILKKFRKMVLYTEQVHATMIQVCICLSPLPPPPPSPPTSPDFSFPALSHGCLWHHAPPLSPARFSPLSPIGLRVPGFVLFDVRAFSDIALTFGTVSLFSTSPSL